MGYFSVTCYLTLPEHLLFVLLLDLDQPSAVSEDAAPTTEPTDSPLWLGQCRGDEENLPLAETPLLPTQPLSLNPEELLPTLTSPLHFVNTHFNGKGQAAGLEIEIQARSQESTLQSPVAPHARPVLSRPQSQESEGDGEDFELLEQGELDLLQEEVAEAEKHLAGINSPPSASSHLQPDDTAS